MTDVTTINVPPDVSRIVEGLRDTGYDLNSAIADIVDNSIAANATQVEITMQLSPAGELFFSIGDNGIGMDHDGLVNAMKYGSRARPNSASLGKFGLGLKTASTAFCRCLVVITRTSADRQPLRAAWDLDKMASANAWDLEFSSSRSLELAMLDKVALNSAGTLVVWNKIDRILPGYKNRTGAQRKTALKRLQDNLTQHLAMVFQRFLDPDDPRAPTITLSINNKTIQAWDPFAIKLTVEPVMEKLQEVVMPSNETASLLVRAFILPRQEEIPSTEDRASVKVSNDLQGIYVYRENRLIHGPDWLGMYKTEPHFSLLRVELSFDHLLDDAFQVDIKKSRILLDDELFTWLRDQFLAGPRKEAERRYRQGQGQKSKDLVSQLHQHSDNTIHHKRSSLDAATVGTPDPQTSEALIKNNQGETKARVRIVDSGTSRPVYIDSAPTLDDGVLWDTVIISGENGVTLNTQHPYYRKVYLPHKDNSIIVQALDYLFWSLAQAELNNSNHANKDALSDFRIDVSRNLKKLVSDLPEPSEES